MKKSFASITTAEALQMVPADQFFVWTLNTEPRQPSDILTGYLARLQSFDLNYTEAAKLVLIDALLAETVPMFPRLKVWKGIPLESDALTGFADYILSPNYAYLKAPLLCAVEAKRDDFVQGRAQCIAEMVACRWNNAQIDREIELHGIVSNGQTWQFYRLTPANAVYETAPYSLANLPDLLGALHFVCAACAQYIPPPTT